MLCFIEVGHMWFLLHWQWWLSISHKSPTHEVRILSSDNLQMVKQRFSLTPEHSFPFFFFFLSSSLLCLRIQLSMIIIFVKVFTSLKDLSISFLWRTEWLYVFTCTNHLGNILALAWLYNSPHKILLIHFQDNCDSKRFFQSSKFLNNVLMWLLSLCY